MDDPIPVTAPRRGGTRILAIGDLVPENEFDLLLDAFADVAEWQPHARLILMGDGPERGALLERRRLLVELIQSKIELLGEDGVLFDRSELEVRE